MTPPAMPHKNNSTIGRICQTNLLVPVCWNAHSGYLLASTAVMITTTMLPMPTMTNTKKNPPPSITT